MTTNYERIKNMTVDEMAEILVSCINLYDEMHDFEYKSSVLKDIYYDKDSCIKDTKQWLQSESEE